MDVRNQFDVVISGMGPSGLAAGWEAVRAGKSVCFLTNYDAGDYRRDQRVFLEADVREYLLVMYNSFARKEKSPEDEKFIQNLIRTGFISIKDVEGFIYRRIQELADSSRIKIMENSTLRNIDLERGKASVSDVSAPEKGQQELTFDYLIGADGIHHHALDVLNEGLDEKEKIKHKRDFKFKLHKFHSSSVSNIELTETLPPDFFPKSQREQKYNVRIKDGLYYGIQFSLSEENKLVCNLNCEIPKELYYAYHAAKADYFQNDTPANKEKFALASAALQNFIENIIREELNADASIHFNNDAEGHPQINLFTTVLKQAEVSYKLSPDPKNPRVFLLIGDAYRTSYYPLGSGLNLALLESAELRKIFNSEPKELQKNLKEYDNFCKKNASEAKKPIVLGSVFRQSIWGKSNKAIDESFNYHKKRVSNPPAHAAFREEPIDAAKLASFIKTDAIYALNAERQNVLHSASMPGVLWLRHNNPDAFQMLLSKIDIKGDNPLTRILGKATLQTLQTTFTDDFVREYADEKGDTFVHSMIRNDTDFKKLNDVYQWLFSVAPDIFAKANKDGLTAIDELCKRFTSLSDFGLEIIADYSDVLNALEKTLRPHFPIEADKISNALTTKLASVEKVKKMIWADLPQESQKVLNEDHIDKDNKPKL